MAIDNTATKKRTRLDRKFDKLLAAEEAGKLGHSKLPRSVRKMLENRMAVIGFIVFFIIIFMCVAAPLFTKFDPQLPDLRSMTKAPTWEHPFGTDKLGRDVFARVLYGGRKSILIGLGSAMGAAFIGVMLGC